MGKTCYSGPVYGAKSLLWTVSQEAPTVSTARQTNIASIILPKYTSWLITELAAQKGSTGSTLFTPTLVDDSSRNTASTHDVGSVNISSSLVAASYNSTNVTPTGGEFEGAFIAGGSTVRMDYVQSLSSAAALASSQTRVWVYGFIRYEEAGRLNNLNVVINTQDQSSGLG